MGTWQVPLLGETVEVTGPTLQDAVMTYINTHNRQVMPPSGSDQKPTKAPDIVGRIKQALVGDNTPAERGASLQGDIREPSALVAGLKGVGDVVLPGSIEDLATQAMVGVGGRVGTMAGRAAGGGAIGQAAQTGAGIAAPVAAGAGIAAGKMGAQAAGAGGKILGEGTDSGDVGRAAMTGAIAGSIGEATRLMFQGTGAGIERYTRGLGNVETKVFNARVRDQIGPTLAKDIAADIPSLREAGIALRNVPDVIKLLDDSTGRQVVGQMFDKVEGEVARKVGTIDLPRDIATAAGRTDLVKAADAAAMKDFNTQAAALAKTLGVPANDSVVLDILTKAGITPNTTNAVAVSGKDAIDMAKQLRHQGLRRGEGIEGRPPRVMAEEVQRRLDTALGNDAVREKYTQLRDDYSKFMDLRAFLERNDPSKIFPGTIAREGATIDLVHLGDRMIKDIGDLPPSRFPNLHREMTGGGTGQRAVDPSAGKVPSMGVKIPFTPLHVHTGSAKTPVPEVPAHLSVGKMPAGKISKTGNIAAGAARVGTTAITPALNGQ